MVSVECWVWWPRWTVCDLREITADVELVAARLGRTRMRGWHTSRSPSSAASQLRSKFESMKDPLVTARWPDWGPARLGPDPAGKYFPKYFHSFYIFNALAFCFCFVHWMKNILYIFADSRISSEEFVCVSPHSAGSGLDLAGVVTTLLTPPLSASWLLPMNGLASCLAGLECF